MEILPNRSISVKSGKRIVPKSYTLRALEELLKAYEKSVSSMTARDFLEWLEAREKQQEEDATKLFGIE